MGFPGPDGRTAVARQFQQARPVEWKAAVDVLRVPGLHLRDLRHTGNTLAVVRRAAAACGTWAALLGERGIVLAIRDVLLASIRLSRVNELEPFLSGTRARFAKLRDEANGT